MKTNRREYKQVCEVMKKREGNGREIGNGLVTSGTVRKRIKTVRIWTSG